MKKVLCSRLKKIVINLEFHNDHFTANHCSLKEKKANIYTDLFIILYTLVKEYKIIIHWYTKDKLNTENTNMNCDNLH